MFASLVKNKITYFILGIYILLVAWWLKINVIGASSPSEPYYYNWSYGFIALIGATYCFFKVAKVWGGHKSILGRGLTFLSLGLFGEWFGLQVWTYFNVVARVEVPYPSLADVGYFSIIPLYGLGIFSIAKAISAKSKLQTATGKLTVLLVPLLMISVSYFLFLKDLSLDFSNPIRTFLDFGYPLGEAITISIALATYELSRGILGGKMKSRILFLIFALTFQYLTDYTFLYQAAAGTYINGGIVDLMYTTSLTIMAIGLVSFRYYE